MYNRAPEYLLAGETITNRITGVCFCGYLRRCTL